jgi:hypothetical protein
LALTPGTCLGPHEVTAPIGVGGMGEVYRATDTNLGRQVAVKSCPRPSRKTRIAMDGAAARDAHEASCVAKVKGFGRRAVQAAVWAKYRFISPHK